LEEEQKRGYENNAVECLLTLSDLEHGKSLSFMYLFQRETPAQKDTDHFSEAERKVSST
jgi:hypothetical protein